MLIVLGMMIYIICMCIAVSLNFRDFSVMHSLMIVNRNFMILFVIVTSMSQLITKLYCRFFLKKPFIDDYSEVNGWILKLFKIESFFFGVAVGAVFWLFPFMGLIKK